MTAPSKDGSLSPKAYSQHSSSCTAQCSALLHPEAGNTLVYIFDMDIWMVNNPLLSILKHWHVIAGKVYRVCVYGYHYVFCQLQGLSGGYESGLLNESS